MRHGVLWRKSSGGTASMWGSRFVSRLLGVVATCRQRGRSVLDFLTSCFEASVRSQPVPLAHPPLSRPLLFMGRGTPRERLRQQYETKLETKPETRSLTLPEIEALPDAQRSAAFGVPGS